MDDVKGLLERAVEGSAWSGVTTDGVFAEAAKRRWRRRITATAVAAVVAVTGTIAIPRLTDDQNTGPQRDLVALAGSSIKFDGSKDGEKEAAVMTKLLPPDRFDEVRKLYDSHLYKSIRVDRVPWGPDLGNRLGPLRNAMPVTGPFAVRTGGGIAAVGVTYVPSDVAEGRDFCPDPVKGCTVEVLSNGDELVTWREEGGVTPEGWRVDPFLGVRSFKEKGGGKNWVIVWTASGLKGADSLGEPPLSPDEVRSLLRDKRLLQPMSR